MAPWHYGQKHSAGNRRAGLGVLWIASDGHRYQLEIFGAAANNLFRCAGHPDWLGGMAGQRRESLGVKSTTSGVAQNWPQLEATVFTKARRLLTISSLLPFLEYDNLRT